MNIDYQLSDLSQLYVLYVKIIKCLFWVRTKLTLELSVQVLLVRYIPLLLSIMWNRIVLFSGDLDGMYEFAILQTRIIDLSL